MEADLFADTLRGDVLDIGGELEPFEAQIIEAVAGHSSQGACCDASAACISGEPVPDVSGLMLADPQPDRPDDVCMLGDRELVWPKPESVGHECTGVIMGIGPREVREPALKLSVLARCVDEWSVVILPRPQHDGLVVKLHRLTVTGVAEPGSWLEVRRSTRSKEHALARFTNYVVKGLGEALAGGGVLENSETGKRRGWDSNPRTTERPSTVFETPTHMACFPFWERDCGPSEGGALHYALH